MTVIDWQAGLWAMLAGLGLGFIFFGGLWLTVRQAARSSHPSLLLIGSFVLRAGVTLGGIYLAGGGQVGQILFCLVGFVIMRQVLLTRNMAPQMVTAPGPGGKRGERPCN